MSDFLDDFAKEALAGIKVPKPEVNYRVSPNPSTKSCSNCIHFDHQDMCSLVVGEVKPLDICNIWQKDEG